MDQLSREDCKTLLIPSSPAERDAEILPFYVAELTEALTKRSDMRGLKRWRRTAEISDRRGPPYLRLLGRAEAGLQGEGQRDHQEAAAVHHSIT